MAAIKSAGFGFSAGVIAALTFSWNLSTKAATEVVAPVREMALTHYAQVAAEKPQMERVAAKVEALTPEVLAMRYDIRAICRALPQAHCGDAEDPRH